MRTYSAPIKFQKAISAMEKSFSYDLKTPQGKQKVRNMAGERFIRHFGLAMDQVAASNQSLSHMYELGHNGQPGYRLFKMVRRKGAIKIVTTPAKMLVPLSDQQRQEGPSGRKVTKRYKFPMRPYLFEAGATLVIKRRAGTKFMWTTDTLNPVPPLKGPVVLDTTKFKNNHKFAFRGAVKSYFETEGRMVMSDVARKYAAAVGKRATRAARKYG